MTAEGADDHVFKIGIDPSIFESINRLAEQNARFADAVVASSMPAVLAASRAVEQSTVASVQRYAERQAAIVDHTVGRFVKQHAELQNKVINSGIRSIVEAQQRRSQMISETLASAVKMSELVRSFDVVRNIAVGSAVADVMAVSRFASQHVEEMVEGFSRAVEAAAVREQGDARAEFGSSLTQSQLKEIASWILGYITLWSFVYDHLDGDGRARVAAHAVTMCTIATALLIAATARSDD